MGSGWHDAPLVGRTQGEGWRDAVGTPLAVKLTGIDLHGSPARAFPAGRAPVGPVTGLQRHLGATSKDGWRMPAMGLISVAWPGRGRRLAAVPSRVWRIRYNGDSEEQATEPEQIAPRASQDGEDRW